MGEFYIDPNQWKKMNKEERFAHLKKSRAARNGNNGNNSSSDPKPAPVPTQYSNANKMSAQEKGLFDMMQNNANANNTPQQRTFLNMVRSMNMSPSSVNVMRTVTSTKVSNLPMKARKKSMLDIFKRRVVRRQ